MAKARPRTSTPAAQGGFGLLEVLVALALMGLGLASVMGLMRMQERSHQRAAAHLAALEQAQELMERWLISPDIKPGRFTGKGRGGLTWQVRVTELESALKPGGSSPAAGARSPGRGIMPGVRPAGQGPPALFGVEVCCRWKLPPRTSRLCLQGQRSGRAPW